MVFFLLGNQCGHMVAIIAGLGHEEDVKLCKQWEGGGQRRGWHRRASCWLCYYCRASNTWSLFSPKLMALISHTTAVAHVCRWRINVLQSIFLFIIFVWNHPPKKLYAVKWKFNICFACEKKAAYPTRKSRLVSMCMHLLKDIRPRH